MSSKCEHCGGALTARQIASGFSCCSKRCATLHRNYPPRECCVDGCTRRHRSNGYCDMHGQRMTRKGTLKVAPWAEMSLEERFWSKVKKGSDDECWEWQGERNNKGYGRFTTWTGGVRRRHLAHRFALAISGELSTDLIVLHSCDNPPCVNPMHMSQGTQLENVRDAISKGRMDMSGLQLRHMRRQA